MAGGLWDVSESPRPDAQPGGLTQRRPGGSGQEEEEEDQHRQHREGRAGEGLQLQPQAEQRGGPVHLWWALPGEGGGQGLVLQSETEGKEDEPQQLGLPRELPHPIPALHLLLPQLPDPDPALVPHTNQQPPVQQPARLHGRLPSRAPVKEIL